MWGVVDRGFFYIFHLFRSQTVLGDVAAVPVVLQHHHRLMEQPAVGYALDGQVQFFLQGLGPGHRQADLEQVLQFVLFAFQRKLGLLPDGDILQGPFVIKGLAAFILDQPGVLPHRSNRAVPAAQLGFKSHYLAVLLDLPDKPLPGLLVEIDAIVEIQPLDVLRVFISQHPDKGGIGEKKFAFIGAAVDALGDSLEYLAVLLL